MKDFELFAMTHYSAFLYFARATTRLTSHHDEDQLASDAFYLMDTSLDNVKMFLKQLRYIGKSIDTSFTFDEPMQDKEFPELKEISDYRDTLVHNPVLGRAVGQGVGMIPAHSELGEAKKSWIYCESLPPEKFTNTRNLIERCRSRYAVYLDTRWKQILSLLDKSRGKFVSRLRLGEQARFAVTLAESATDRFTPTTLNPGGMSGQFVLDVESRSNKVNFPPLPVDPPRKSGK